MDTKKRSLIATERDDAARAAWRTREALSAATQYVFVDECGMQTNMTSRYARAPRGERAYGHVPRNHHKNTTLFASLTYRGMGECMAIEGAADGEAFVTGCPLGSMRAFLVPMLVPGQVVVLDNLSVHKDARVAPLIAAAGCRLCYLPSYSPDFNPIELAFSKIKTAMRREEARTNAALVDAIGPILDTVTTADVVGWYHHCDYFLEVEQPS
ncbi:MAG: IS630 family transposase [Chloroflexota bacterium]|nr:IS630 family transposase [Chloroflexota bacterium]